MGSKRPSLRTLPSGEKAVHHPDDTQYLVPASLLISTLISTESDRRDISDALVAERLGAVDSKRESLAVGNEVPGDQRAV